MADPQTYVVTINHIVVTSSVLLGGIFAFVKFYVKSISSDIREDNNKSITKTRIAIETSIGKEIEELKHGISTDVIKSKVKDYIAGEQRVVENDLRTIKEAVLDTRSLIMNQQEQLLVMQTAITEIKPKVDYIDERLKKVENRVEKNGVG